MEIIVGQIISLTQIQLILVIQQMESNYFFTNKFQIFIYKN